MLGLPGTPWGQPAKVFGHQTLHDNVALLDAAVLLHLTHQQDLLDLDLPAPDLSLYESPEGGQP